MNFFYFKRLLTLVLIVFVSTEIQAQLFVNEWMASNSNTVTDNVGEYEDWIEIYNASSIPIDLANYYISDDIADPLLWQIPTGSPALTTVPANGFLILWADDDTDQGAHHLPFKLSADGEVILLTAPDGLTIVDQVLFGSQNTNVSFGRTTDAGAVFDFFIAPTAGSSNNNTAGPLTYNAIFDIPVLQGADDAEQPVGQIFTTINNNVLNIVNDWSGDQTVGIRFQNIPFPSGATINNAYIQFTNGLSFASLDPANLNIRSA